MELITKYAILTRPTNLRVHFTTDVPCDILEDQKDISFVEGTLIQIYQTQSSINNTATATSDTKWSTVKVMNYVRNDPVYENLYDCPQLNLRKVSEDLWPYVISIREPQRRLRMLNNKEQCRLIIYLQCKDLVSVSGESFGRSSVQYDCIIRYIGPVSELQPVGYFFGLELLNLDCGYSPQSHDIPFSQNYTKCDPELSLFVTADNISPISSETKKTFSASNFISDTIDRVRTGINPNSCLRGENVSRNSLLRAAKSKKKEPSAKFYVSTSSSSADQFNRVNNSEMERISNNTNNNNAAELKSEKIIHVDNDDFNQSIQNYEKSLERQHASSTGTHHIQYTHTPPSILKRRSPSGLSSSKENSSSSKPVTIMSLEDRDIVVIDKADIRESTKNENSVIVLDKSVQQDVDLVELLGSNWPSPAGDVATILNKSPISHTQPAAHAGSGGGSSNSSLSSANQIKTERNKSPNLLSHIATSRSDRSYQNNGAPMNISPLNTSVNGGDSIRPSTDNLAAAAAATTNRLTLLNEEDFVHPSPLQEVPETGLGVGSMVEVSIPEASEDLYGVIRWIGVPPGTKDVMVGVELEEEQNDKKLLTTDGSFNSVPLFKCLEGRALFVNPSCCAIDRRFVEAESPLSGKPNPTQSSADTKIFGQVECPSVAGAVVPLKILNLYELEEICGKFKGIQGHHNSCYLDATLFSMFTFTSVFDSLLFRQPEPEDIPHYAKVQRVLREEIVNPLRKNLFVRADRVMKLRQLLDKLSSVSGLMSEEKDPEEFLNSLLAQIMRVEPFLKLSSGQDAYFYQLFVEKDERLSFPSVQQLFEQSFHSSDIKLKEVPSCLIIQMPRFGKNFKMYPRILPSQVLDVTDIIEDSPRQCTVCGTMAEYECRDCFGILQGGHGLESTAFCQKCLDTVHMHVKRANHSSKKLAVPQDFRMMAEHTAVPRLYMELFAVVCIETSHYVAFVKTGLGPDAPWCFFDSMADRKGEQNGYNIPEMIPVPDLPLWLSDDGARTINESSSNDKMLPEHAKRLFCDAYMCMYQSTDVMMYR